MYKLTIANQVTPAENPNSFKLIYIYVSQVKNKYTEEQCLIIYLL